jgi:RHS repeat-associated protein
VCVVQAAQFGTTRFNGAGDEDDGAISWKSTAPPAYDEGDSTGFASTADRLVTQFVYHDIVDEEEDLDGSGRLRDTTDPAGTVTTSLFDDLGRKTTVTQDDGGSSERDTTYVYNGLGGITSLTAENAANQVTTYLYEDAVSASRVTNTIYPDSSDTTSSGTDQVKVTYNTDGSAATRTDQRGTVLTFTYNERRQTALQGATTLGGADDYVKSIGRAYDDLARVETITSYQNDDGTGTVRNQIQYTYDDLGRITKSQQDHDGAVDGSSPNVQYAYDTSATSNVFDDGARPESITYPSGRVIHYDYGTADAVDDRLHRIQNLYETDTMGAHLAHYSYNGTGRTAVVDYPQPDVKLDYFQGSSGTYAGYDRFGRVKDQFWAGYNSTDDAVRIKYGYDYASNRTWREDVVAAANSKDHDWFYDYDSLHRLVNAQQGDLTGTFPNYTGITSRNQEQDWTLDLRGNWSMFNERDTDMGTNWDLEQERTSSDANEITAIDMSSTHVAHDAAGNMTKVPTSNSWSAHYDMTYDAWNRLVVLDTGSNTPHYAYDGLHRRIGTTIMSGMYSVVELHFYYNTSWQVVESRAGSLGGPVSSNPWRQLVWHPYYVDALACQFYDQNLNGDLDENDDGLYYVTHDANFNVTALIDDSGDVFERYRYSPYGELTVMEPDFSLDANNTSDVSNPYTYTGRRLDFESGLYYYRHRYYSAQLGRFITRDPIGYEGSQWNLYEYVGGRPLVSLDPDGTDIYVERGNNSGNLLNDTFHKSICVDTWDSCCDELPTGKRCFSFGEVEGGFFGSWSYWGYLALPGQWAGLPFDTSVIMTFQQGVVYEPDPVEDAVVSRRKKTTCDEDKKILRKLVLIKGRKDMFSVGYFNCRKFSNLAFDLSPGEELVYRCVETAFDPNPMGGGVIYLTRLKVEPR